jgi:protein-tyrosine phosphatase
MNEIIPLLYIGNCDDAAQQGGQFYLVVNCTPSLPFAARTGGECVRVAIDDHPLRNPEMYQVATESPVLEKMHSALTSYKPVLVHCHAGMQRSCAIVAFYLMKYYGLNLSDAMKLIQQNRRVAFYGGATFLPALAAFEKKNIAIRDE